MLSHCLKVSLEEASTSIDRALNATLAQLFSGGGGGGLAESTSGALTQLRFPPESEREVAKAAEIYERTLQASMLYNFLFPIYKALN
jgi:hypothetical protein